MLPLLLILLAPLLTPAETAVCSSPPRPIASPTNADEVYFLFVIDNSWPEHKIAQQKALYQMIACEIPRSPKFLVGTIYAYGPKRASDYELNAKSLTTADRFSTTLDDVVERSYRTRPHLPYDRSRCARMHAVLEAMRLADFTYDSSVHTHYIFPTDDTEDDFVNDCDPAWTFKQSARNILNEATPNHLFLDVIRIGPAQRWTQYGERVQLADWTDRSINQRDVSHLFAHFLDGALTGSADNDVIVLGTNGLVLNERPKDLMTFLTEPPPPSSSTTSTVVTSVLSTTTLPSTTTTSSSTISESTTSLTSTAAPNSTKAAAAQQLPPRRGRKAAASATIGEDENVGLLKQDTPDDIEGPQIAPKPGRERRNTSEIGQERDADEQKGPPEEKHVVLGIQTPFTKETFYIIVVVTTVVMILLLWLLCGLIFYCCYRDDDSIKKHDARAAEDEEEPMLISGLHENDWEKPSSIMISDHLRKVKEDRYNEEQLRSSESRGTITVEG